MTEIKIICPGEDFSEALKIRIPVFVQEQNIPQENELDENDKISYHAVLYERENEKEKEIPVACGRLYFSDTTAHIGRVAVLKQHRRKGYAAAVCKKLIGIAASNKMDAVILHAQKYTAGLYEKLGFRAVGDEFLEENIPHIEMILKF